MENNRRNDSSDLNADLFDSLVGEREDIYQQLFPVDRNSALIESRYKTEGEDEFYCSQIEQGASFWGQQILEQDSIHASFQIIDFQFKNHTGDLTHGQTFTDLDEVSRGNQEFYLQELIELCSTSQIEQNTGDTQILESRTAFESRSIFNGNSRKVHGSPKTQCLSNKTTTYPLTPGEISFIRSKQ